MVHDYEYGAFIILYNLPIIIRTIKMKMMSWAGCLANISAKREAYKTSVGKPEVKGHFGRTSSADEMVVKPVQITGPGGPEEGSGPDYIAYAFVFLCSIIVCRLYKLALSDLPESLGT
jgi:hypothetical protein